MIEQVTHLQQRERRIAEMLLELCERRGLDPRHVTQHLVEQLECENCGQFPCVIGCPAHDPAYEAYCAEQEARGELAGVPERMGCPDCFRQMNPHEPMPMDESEWPQNKVVALGPTVEAHRDPTQTYKLACGHTVI